MSNHDFQPRSWELGSLGLRDHLRALLRSRRRDGKDSI